MEPLTTIPEIEESSLELLEAVGFRDVESLAGASVESLRGEIERANGMLKISKTTPGLSEVAGWVETARLRVGESEPQAVEVSGANAQGAVDADPAPAPATGEKVVNYEETDAVARMLEVAPFAIPLPARDLVRNKLGVSAIPAGILLNRYSGDLDVRVEERLPKKHGAGRGPVSSGVQLSDGSGPQQRLEIDTSKVRSMDEMGPALAKGPAIKVSPADDRVALLRAPRTSTNKGRNPNSRWYIRGVLHSHPVGVYLGALTTLCLLVMVPLTLVASALLFLSGEMPERFEWVPKWFLAFPLVLPLFGIAWLIWGMNGSCRICGQRLFVHRAHLKNIKAHHVKGLGYILPLCVQILIFRWFRCTHCGTPVRIKE